MVKVRNLSHTSSKIAHIYHWYNVDEDTLDRMQQAQETWKEFYKRDRYGVLQAEFKLEKEQRSSLDIGEKRAVPFIKDVFNFGINLYPDCRLFLYTNSDISLVKDGLDLIRGSLNKWGCGYSHRLDLDKKDFPKEFITKEQLIALLPLGNWGAGSDTFFFTREWWEEVEEGFPDALVGFEGWDFCMTATMLRGGLPAPIKWITYHQKHLPYWKEHRLDAQGQMYNREVCTKWAVKNNLGHLLGYKDFLFKVPTPYNVVI